jgi:hypothetical protein
MAKDIEERAKRREKTIEEALESKDFYDPKPLLEKSGDINVIWGQRSNGKTYAYLKNALENFRDTGRTFVYVRRWAEDISVKNMAKLMSPLPIEDIFGTGSNITFNKGAFWLNKESEKEPSCIGWAISLNQVAHTKSQTFTGAQIVILDEFLQLKSERQLRDEFDAWEQTLSTVLRTTNDAKIFILGNSVSKYSPYFTPYGIDPNQMKQGELKVIDLPNEKGEPTRVVADWCAFNHKVGKRTSKYVRGSKMAKTGEWEIEEVANIPHVDNEKATEQLVCSMLDSVMGINLGIFLRRATWHTLENINGIYYTKPHAREFLVIRQTEKKSSYYHLTTVKDLSYSSWTNLSAMWKDIEEECDIDIMRELDMGRVYAEDSFTGDYFYHTYLSYLNVSVRDLL